MNSLADKNKKIQKQKNRIENNLKILRKKKGDTQDQVAQAVGVSKRSYIYWENGERQIKPDKAQALSEYFGVSVGYLLGYDDKEFNKAFLPDKSSDFSDVMEIGTNRMLEILGNNSEKFINKILKSSDDNFTIPNRVNLLTAIGLLPLEYASIVLYYATLSEEKADMIRDMLKISIKKDFQNAE